MSLKDKMRVVAGLFVVLFTLGLQSCDEFEYSPYEVRLKDDEKNINQINIQRIQKANLSPSKPLRFILTADTQGFYEENAEMVKHINQQQNIDFVLLSGDITDFGLTKEYRLVHQDFKELKMPYVAVIGNHDAVNNGKEVFKAMYGEYDLSFTAGGRKFILLNTNYLEFNKKVPDLNWLEKELAATARNEPVFVVSHIAPSSPEFGPENKDRYTNLLSTYNVRYSLHGHNHKYESGTLPGSRVPYLITGSTETREYIIFTVTGPDITFERVKF
ncbi:metallophosphoesterase family protein [Pontibacter arcticus]|uniref:Metallophosphoesterase n=1 Tax=Pontibacter arcticus TaxID=2080288 RepID=A0A364RBU2_9BACT|nr:metallophosphoesterase [Pontibacter arcticus]RAU81725.1 metallophosphoesterase [Pontibacter arcticus]